MEYVLQKNRIFTISNLCKLLSNFESATIRIPNDVYNRTKLMCAFIEDEVDSTFDIDDFIMLLYMDFIKYAVRNYNPKRVLTESTRKSSSSDDDVLILQMDGQTHKIYRNNIKHTYLDLKISKKEYRKGQLLLDELESLYSIKIPFDVMLSNLLINFIEDYKTGTNKRAYTSVVKMLKNIYE